MRSDATKIILLRMLWSSIILQSVMVPFFYWKGLSFQEVLLIQSTFSLALLSLELPTGYLSDLVGRRRTLIVAALCRGGAGLAFLSLSGFWGMAAAYALVALSITLFSGTDIAALYESIDHDPAADRHSRWIATFFWLPYAMAAASALLGGQLYQSSGQLAAWMNFLLTVLTIPIAFSLSPLLQRRSGVDLAGSTRSGTVEKRGHSSHVMAGLLSNLRHRRLRAVVLSAAVFLLPVTTTIYAFQKLWIQFGFTPSSMGLVFAGGGGMSALGAYAFPFLVRSVPPRTLYATMAALTSSGLLLPFSGQPASSVIGMYLIQAAAGFSGVFHSRIINAEIADVARSSTNSLSSFISKTLAAATVLVAATIVGAGSEQPVFLITLCVFGLGLLLVTAVMGRPIDWPHAAGDPFIGTR